MAKIELALDPSNFVIDKVVKGHDVKAITADFSTGPVAGFVWQLMYEAKAGPSAPVTQELTPWMFISRAALQAMLDEWQKHLDKPPGARMQTLH